ncbi:hypothetical protein [Thermosipho atlanticus]|uniref:Uncharacterized protein n=1 Tax=Thermosipho atlanticus DSM 15807 TaxID=1123380 RepID=A0A1M5S1H5_9BACT|nr:hypothetical protein [Thermosipho atlanticus]SHH32271.1 hypothetical protein SAMN02745199_0747 [Thermosipho atlanticus DSM 15807]
MKKILLVFLIVYNLVFSIDNVFVFRNKGIINVQLPFTSELVLPLKNEENIIFLEKSEFYKVDYSDLKYIEFLIVSTKEDLQNHLSKEVKIINNNPLVLERRDSSEKYVYFYHPQLNLWCKTEKNNLEALLYNKRLIAKNAEGTLLISKPMSWNLIYDLKTNGDLYLTYMISGNLDKQSNVFLIDSYYQSDLYSTTNLKKQTLYEQNYQNSENFGIPEIINEKAVINLGKVEKFNGKYFKVFKLGTIKSYEDIPSLSFNFYTNSFENKFFNIYRLFENSKDNGLGVPLLSGQIRIYERYNDTEFIKYISNLPKTGENKFSEINLGEGWTVYANLELIDNYKTEKFEERTFKIHIFNTENTKRKIMISISGNNLELRRINSSMEISKKIVLKDKIKLYLIIDKSGVLDISLRSNHKNN